MKPRNERLLVAVVAATIGVICLAAICAVEVLLLENLPSPWNFVATGAMIAALLAITIYQQSDDKDDGTQD